MKKTILHITAGDDNWTPSEEELKAIANKFRRAMLKATPTHTPVVPTRNAVHVTVLEYDPVMYVTSGYSQPVLVTNHSNPGTPLMTPGLQTYTITTTAPGNP